MAPFTKAETIWFNGAFVPWDDARVHVMAHGLHYGTGVFEGIRSYATDDGPAVFRLDDHIARLFASAALFELVKRGGGEQAGDVIVEAEDRGAVVGRVGPDALEHPRAVMEPVRHHVHARVVPGDERAVEPDCFRLGERGHARLYAAAVRGAGGQACWVPVARRLASISCW